MSYWIKLLVQLGDRWHFDKPQPTFNISGLNPIEIRSYDSRYELNDKGLWDRTDIDKVFIEFLSAGYATKESANTAGNTLCNSLVWLSAEGLAIDPGYVSLLQQGKPWTVGEGVIPERRSQGYAGGGKGVLSIDLLERRLNELSSFNGLSLEKIRAISYIANASFPNGIRTSLFDGMSIYLAKVAAIESMAPQLPKNAHIRKFIDEAILLLEKTDYLEQEDEHSLKQSLGNLKRESIARRCIHFIEQHPRISELPPAAAEATAQYNASPSKRFKEIYRLRSSFMHGDYGPEEHVQTVEDHYNTIQCGLDLDDLFSLIVLNQPEP